jgi:hypothetical protein
MVPLGSLLLAAALLTALGIPGIAAGSTAAAAAAAAGAAGADTTVAGAVAAETMASLPVELDAAYFAKLADLPCTDVKAAAYREVPRFVLADRPDLLYEFVLYWENRCPTTETVFRTLLLGSIWDGGFDEDLYDEDVIEYLIERYDPQTKSRNPSLKKEFDDFTTSWADQLLPHVPHRSLEAFFCLFYAGKTDAAWALLRSEDLEETWLRYYYDEEMTYLAKNTAIPTLAVTGGGWWPAGPVEFAGDKPLVGLLTGVRWPHWLLRFVFEVRVGRTMQPYWVNESGYFGRSNRFDAILIGAEGGRILTRKGRHGLEVFGGAGLDAVKPFQDEDLTLTSLNLNLGLGYRLFLGKNQNWVLGADLRHEWIGERNEKTSSMSGQAWSLRFSLGFLFEEGKNRRLKGLGG